MNEQTFNKKIAENLVKYRKLNGFTQSEIAEMIEYTNKSVSKWERGEGVPSPFVLFKLSEIYGITVSELIGQIPMSKSSASLSKENAKKQKEQLKAKKKAVERANKQKKKEKKNKK